ncbi:hypothetical protein SJAV_10240 [Sulfurisphaera javensis]|uniref:Uncharacterized protein n=1 Tax=Sulfurisphaera javensis TaxID=2049879 RepID=A0AAT9GQM0_9CREN
MEWKFKNTNKLNANSEKTCTVDEAIKILKNKYNIDIDLLTSITSDVLIKYLTEHKIGIEEIKKKYSNISEIENIINDILKVDEEKNKL